MIDCENRGRFRICPDHAKCGFNPPEDSRYLQWTTRIKYISQKRKKNSNDDVFSSFYVRCIFWM